MIKTLDSLKERPDWGLRIFACLKRKFGGSNAASILHYSPLDMDEISSEDGNSDVERKKSQLEVSEQSHSQLRGVWKFNIIATLIAQAIFDFHMG